MEEKTTRKWITAVGAISIISPLTILITIVFGLSTHAPTQFIDSNKATLYAHMQSLPAGGVVLSAYKTGNEIPAWTELRVVQGLRVETIHNEQVERDVNQFFQAETTRKERLAILTEYDVDYLFFGSDEMKIGNWTPAGDSCFSLLKQMAPYTLYAINGECVK